jgi:putative oxidoreductase
MSLGLQGIKSLSHRPELGLFTIRAAVGAVLAINGWNKFAGGKAVLEAVGANIRHVGLDIGAQGAFPLFFGIMAAGSELLGGILIIIGVLFRASTVFLIATMLVATVYKIQTGSGALNDFGYPLVILLVLVGLLFTGSGRFSIQRD